MDLCEGFYHFACDGLRTLITLPVLTTGSSSSVFAFLHGTAIHPEEFYQELLYLWFHNQQSSGFCNPPVRQVTSGERWAMLNYRLQPDAEQSIQPADLRPDEVFEAVIVDKCTWSLFASSTRTIPSWQKQTTSVLLEPEHLTKKRYEQEGKELEQACFLPERFLAEFWTLVWKSPNLQGWP